MEKLCTNKNHSYKHNEQINKQNIENSECFGVKYIKIDFTIFFLKYGFGWLNRDIFLHFRILLSDDCCTLVSCDFFF